MIGIVVVSHGKLARELVRATEHVVGEQEYFRSISIEAEDDIDARREQIRETVAACNTGKGVIIATDMFGGTPSNLAISVMPDARIDVIAGVNLPMLIKLIEVREDVKFDEAVRVGRDAGQKYIRVASEVMDRTA
ncbi:PTS sugar transporter subunit IIA [Henriciella sp.]|uniref:PTS sugar transporter subunit IIA n=1 Tax=Henriciella sp. TaxID=1968823 RepID=UPI002613E515|nr:PTS sugar transporter subunit IIA [Henriciella sp.]